MRRSTAAGALIALLASTSVAAEPAPIPRLNIREPARMCTLAEPVRCRELPPGTFLDAPTWGLLDETHRRLQDAETRLTAENRSLRDSASAWSPGWKSLASAVLAGVALGVYAASRE